MIFFSVTPKLRSGVKCPGSSKFESKYDGVWVCFLTLKNYFLLFCFFL